MDYITAICDFMGSLTGSTDFCILFDGRMRSMRRISVPRLSTATFLGCFTNNIIDRLLLHSSFIFIFFAVCFFFTSGGFTSEPATDGGGFCDLFGRLPCSSREDETAPF